MKSWMKSSIKAQNLFFYSLYSFDEKKWHCWSGTEVPELRENWRLPHQLLADCPILVCVSGGLLDFAYQISLSPPTFSNSVVPLVCERTAVMQDVLWGNTELEQITFHSDNGTLGKVTTYYSYLEGKFQW